MFTRHYTPGVKFFFFFSIFFFKHPEFWYGRGKVPVKKNYIPGVKKNQKNSKKISKDYFFFQFFFSKTLNFGMVAGHRFPCGTWGPQEPHANKKWFYLITLLLI